MTQDELDAAIAEIIITQDKPKSTGNSHKRKQWEKQRYWYLCTVGKHWKFGSLKDYKKLCKFYDSFNHWIRKFPHLDRNGRMAGFYYNVEEQYFRKWSCNRKWLRKYAQRRVRQYREGIVDGGMYRKIYDYVWECD